MTADASSYDQVPYTSLAFPQTHPDHLAAVACIFGLTPPPVERCRVLELGCASGGNLVPMAFNLPGSEFVGIDHSERQVTDAQATVRSLGLRNIHIAAASIEEVDAEWGTFDYIICHGVFSWVDPPVQDRILQIAGRQLNPDGIAYISYNTYPGWHMRLMVRDMMRYHAGQFADPGEQVAQARALMTFLASAAEPATPYGLLLAGEAERADRAADSYLFHEHLERTNLPLYFHEFVARAAEAGLQFLSESVVSEMLTAHFPPPVGQTLERISPDILHLEQYMDFVRNRQFRQTLLCRADAHPRRVLSPEVLRGRLVSSDAVPDPEDSAADETSPVRFSNGKQRAELTSPISKAAFGILAGAWPSPVAVDALCDRAIVRAAARMAGTSDEQACVTLLQDLFGAVMYGLATLHTVPPPCTNEVSAQPRAHPLAAAQAAVGPLVVNAHHQMIELDAFSREVMVLADGRRHRQDVLEALQQRPVEPAADGGDQPAAELAAAPGDVSDRLDTALATLVRHALLIS